MKKKFKVLISACLLGDNVKYSGGNNLTPELVTLLEKYNVDIVKVCPECFGGLPIPRVPSEIRENKVFSKDNRDITEEFLVGAEKTLEIAKENEVDFVILKERSRSCGSTHIYDGSFSGNIIPGQGITAKRLTEEKIKVFSEENLEEIEVKYEDLTRKISDPEVISNQEEWRKMMKEHSDIEPIVLKYREYKTVKQNFEDSKEMLNDPDMKDLAEVEMLESKEKLPVLESELKILLIPKDPDDDKNVICEIRGGAGGDEAALFSATLFRMYSMYCDRKGWKLDVLNENSTELGGYKEISFMITGKGAYSRLKFESGVHRVQRVPDTEASGRIHTSTASVSILPEVGDVEININPADVKMEVFRASGAGGQHVNKTSSAVRLIHIPTGMVAECQTERSQFQNRDYAMKLLQSKLYEKEKAERDQEIDSARRSQIGNADRSEKIRTYNYPQGRITDHRIGFSVFKFQNFLDGDLDEMIDNLITADTTEKLKNS